MYWYSKSCPALKYNQASFNPCQRYIYHTPTSTLLNNSQARSGIKNVQGPSPIGLCVHPSQCGGRESLLLLLWTVLCQLCPGALPSMLTRISVAKNAKKKSILADLTLKSWVFCCFLLAQTMPSLGGVCQNSQLAKETFESY